MTLTRKPQAGNVAEAHIDELINRGGSVAQAPKQPQAIPLRAAPPARGLLRDRIDRVLEQRPIKKAPAHVILEAIHEKLRRDTRS